MVSNCQFSLAAHYRLSSDDFVIISGTPLLSVFSISEKTQKRFNEIHCQSVFDLKICKLTVLASISKWHLRWLESLWQRLSRLRELSRNCFKV